MKAQWRWPRWSESRAGERRDIPNGVLVSDCLAVTEAIWVELLGYGGTNAQTKGVEAANFIAILGAATAHYDANDPSTWNQQPAKVKVPTHIHEGYVTADLAALHKSQMVAPRLFDLQIAGMLSPEIKKAWPEAEPDTRYLDLLERHNQRVSAGIRLTEDGIDAVDVTQALANVISQGHDDVYFVCAARELPDGPVYWTGGASTVVDVDKPHLVVEYKRHP